ncbi:MAG: ABC transporter permease [Kineosporiaceae bacterium]|nr:ABC transporter permease [Kineosporiaceae bacterium]
MSAELVSDESSSAPPTSAPAPSAPAAAPAHGRSPGQLAWRRLRRNKVAMASLFLIVVIVLLAIFAPLVTRLLGVTVDADSSLVSEDGSLPISGPTLAHPFGIEPGTGRDVLALLLYGARVTLFIVLCATVLTITIGVLIGTIAAASRGRLDRILSWVMDLTLTFPQLLLLLALSNVITQRLTAIGLPEGNPSRIAYLILFFAVFGWPYIARIVRGQVISLREREFVEAAVAMGASRRRIVLTELIPNLWAPVLVYASITLPAFISYEATLAFLNVGTDASMPTWGKLLQDSIGYFQVYPAYLLFPAGALVVTVLAFNLLGDAVRDALDPRAGRV